MEDGETVLENSRLGEREQTAYLQYPGDGLLDILIGLWLVGFGLWMLVNNVTLFAIIPILCLPAWRSMKKSITAPRMRRIDFTPAPNAIQSLMGIILIIVLSLALLMVLGLVVFWGQSTGNAPPWLLTSVTWLREHASLAFGLFGALLFGISAAMFGIRRLYAYALLTMIVFTGNYLLATPLWLAVIVMGAVIFLSGTILLLRFLRRFPVEQMEL